MNAKMQKLGSIFGLAMLGGILGACSTTPDLTNTATAMIYSNDTGLQAMGYTLLRKDYKNIDQMHSTLKSELLRLDAEKTAREEAARAKMQLTQMLVQECPVIKEKGSDGRIIVRIDRENCKKLPATQLSIPTNSHP